MVEDAEDAIPVAYEGCDEEKTGEGGILPPG